MQRQDNVEVETMEKIIHEIHPSNSAGKEILQSIVHLKASIKSQWQEVLQIAKEDTAIFDQDPSKLQQQIDWLEAYNKNPTSATFPDIVNVLIADNAVSKQKKQVLRSFINKLEIFATINMQRQDNVEVETMEKIIHEIHPSNSAGKDIFQGIVHLKDSIKSQWQEDTTNC